MENFAPSGVDFFHANFILQTRYGKPTANPVCERTLTTNWMSIVASLGAASQFSIPHDAFADTAVRAVQRIMPILEITQN